MVKIVSVSLQVMVSTPRKTKVGDVTELKKIRRTSTAETLAFELLKTITYLESRLRWANVFLLGHNIQTKIRCRLEEQIAS